MALSNMRNEPRRELTESGIGIAAFVIFTIVDYRVAHWWTAGFTDIADRIGFTALSMAAGFVLIPLTIGLVHLTHWFGENICRWLSAVGMDPRPVRNSGVQISRRR